MSADTRKLSGTLWHAIAPSDSDVMTLEKWAAMLSPAERRVLHATLLLADRRVTPAQLLDGYTQLLNERCNVVALRPVVKHLLTAPCKTCGRPMNRDDSAPGPKPTLCVPCATAKRKSYGHTTETRARDLERKRKQRKAARAAWVMGSGPGPIAS